MKCLNVVLMLVGMISVPCLADFTYFQNFDAAALTLAESGWTSTAVIAPSKGLYAAIGYGGSACFQTTSNTWAPTIAPAADGTRPVSSVLFGDVATQFGGDGITVDYYVYSTTTAADRLSLEFTSAASKWRYEVFAAGSTDFFQQWANVSVTFESGWTREEAIAAGWTEVNGSSESFADSLAGVTGWDLWQGNISAGGKTFQLRVDNISFSTYNVPEPATLGLIICGSTIIMARRKK